jgi:NADH-quinone oxidoreductase subunit G
MDNPDRQINSVKSKFIVYQGSHGCSNAQNADIILPSTSFIEKTSKYASCEGRYQYAQSSTLPLNQSKHSFSILSAIFNEISHTTKKSSDQIIEENIHNLLPSINFSLNKTQTNYFSSPYFCNNSILTNDIYLSSSIFDNFYSTDIISQSSQNMSKCSKELLNKNPFNS